MANEQNLKSNSERTPKERQELARKAGKASGKARRERKTLKEYVIAALDGEIEVKGEKTSLKDAMMQTLVINAVRNNDLASIKYIAELIGEAPAQKVEVTGKDGRDLYSRDLSREEARKFIEEMGKEYGWSGYE